MPTKPMIILTLSLELSGLLMPKSQHLHQKPSKLRVSGESSCFLELVLSRILLTVIILFSRSTPPARLKPSPVSSSLCKTVTRISSNS